MAPQAVRHALEEDDAPDRTPRRSRTRPDPAGEPDRTGHTRRSPPSNRRQVARALRARGALGAPGDASRAPPRSTPQRSSTRRRAVGGHAPPAAPVRTFAKPGGLGPGSAGAGRTIRKLQRATPVRHTRSGRPIVQGHAVPETVVTARRSRSQTPTRVLCWAVQPGSPRPQWRPSPASRASFRRMAGLGPFAPIPARPGPRRPAALYRPAPRRRPATRAKPASPGHALGRRVRHAGRVRVKCRQLCRRDT
jgi:hypothetical protein